ncbi:MAG: tetratricopeptide repeat protein [Planctomycetes bacterium]|nr:tetratricopeptide repeat protein [Planctomycetota bacterium]
MAGEGEFVFAAGETDFEERVVRGSWERPIVVDFWAPWCGPCRALSPVLEEVVASFDGALALAEVNVDDAPRLSQQYGISGIPAVKVFRAGRIVSEFVGAKARGEIREILSHVAPSKADEKVASGRRQEDAGRLDEAEALYRQALAARGDHPGAFLGLARIAIERHDHEAARDLASRVAPGVDEHDQAAALLARLDFTRECAEQGGAENARKSSAEAPNDLGALHALASCLAAEQDYTGALELLIRIVECDKGYRDGAPKRAMLRIFTIVGIRSALADEYRSRLARALY